MIESDLDLTKNPIRYLVEFFFSERTLAYVVRILVLVAGLFGVILVFFSLNEVYEWMVWWKFVLVVVLAFLFSYFTAARYVLDLYELSSFYDALQYHMICSFFGFFPPVVSVSKGRLKIKPDEVNLVDRIGGPGEVKIKDNSIVMFEKLTGLSKVVGKGDHPISRYEFIKEVVSLDEHRTRVQDVQAMTLDGIPLRVKEIEVRFKLREREPDWMRDRGNTVEGESYVEAVRNYAYNRRVSEEGFLSMYQMIDRVITVAAERYINRHFVDQIVTPADLRRDSRQAFKEALSGPEVRAAMKQIGARLIGLELGPFEFPDAPIERYRLGKWRESKRGEIRVLEAESKAFELARQDAIRSRTQAEMIKGILTALDDLQIKDAKDMDALIKLRTAQILDTWAGLYRSRTEEKFDIDRYDDRKSDGDEE